MKKTYFSFIAILLCTLAIGQNGTNLRMNLEKNKVYRLKATSEQTILQTVNGNQQTIESKSNYAVSLKMIDATPGFIVTEVRIDTIDINTNTMGKTVNTRSADEGNIESKESSDIMSFFMNKLSKNSLFTKMDYTGKVTEIVNSKMLSDKILKDTSLITLTDPAAAALKVQIKNMVSNDAIKTIIDMFTYNLPGKAVNNGEEWTVTTTSNSGGMSLDITTIYHLNSVTGNTANVSAESNIKTSPNAVPMESGGAKITFDDFKGISKSSITIDVRTGLVIENVSKTRITGNLGVSMPGMNMQIPMDINSDSRTISIQ